MIMYGFFYVNAVYDSVIWIACEVKVKEEVPQHTIHIQGIFKTPCLPLLFLMKTPPMLVTRPSNMMRRHRILRQEIPSSQKLRWLFK